MDESVKKAVRAIQDRMHREVKDLPPDLYREVLEEISSEIEARLEALDQEQEDKELP